MGCTTTPQKLSPEVIYKKDVTFWVGDKKIVGMGVAPEAESYKLYIDYPKGKIDFLTLTTCHRQVTVENKDHGFNYLFKPTAIEKEGICPLDIGIYDKKGRHGWAYLFFENAANLLAAKVECNGEQISADGVSVCQGPVGSIQRINFDSPEVIAASSEGCEITKMGKFFQYKISKGFCYFSFKDPSGQFHDHTSFGHETFIVRE